MFLKPKSVGELVSQIKALPSSKRKLIAFVGRHPSERTDLVAKAFHEGLEKHGVAFVQIPFNQTPHGVARNFKKSFKEIEESLKKGDDFGVLTKKSKKELIDFLEKDCKVYPGRIGVLGNTGPIRNLKKIIAKKYAVTDWALAALLRKQGISEPIVHFHSSPRSSGYDFSKAQLDLFVHKKAFATVYEGLWNTGVFDSSLGDVKTINRGCSFIRHLNSRGKTLGLNLSEVESSLNINFSEKDFLVELPLMHTPTPAWELGWSPLSYVKPRYFGDFLSRLYDEVIGGQFTRDGYLVVSKLSAQDKAHFLEKASVFKKILPALAKMEEKKGAKS